MKTINKQYCVLEIFARVLVKTEGSIVNSLGSTPVCQDQQVLAKLFSHLGCENLVIAASFLGANCAPHGLSLKPAMLTTDSYG
jgi:hypothetical protein